MADEGLNDSIAQLREIFNGWMIDVNAAENQLEGLESNEIALQKLCQGVFRNCTIQITFFIAVVNGVAVLMNTGTRLLSNVPCWTISVAFALTLVFLLGIGGPVSFAFYQFHKFKYELKSCIAGRNNLKSVARGLVIRYDNMKGFSKSLGKQANIDLLFEESKESEKKLIEIRDGYHFAKVQDNLYKGLTGLVAIGATIYAVVFPVVAFVLLCR